MGTRFYVSLILVLIVSPGVLSKTTSGVKRTGAKNIASSNSYSGKSVIQSSSKSNSSASTIGLALEPVVGFNYSGFAGIEGKDGASVESRGGFHGGVGLLVGSGTWQLDTGLLYSSRGASFKNLGNNTVSLDVDIENKYLDIPLLARYNTTLSERAKIFLRGGAVLGFLLNSKSTTTLNVSTMHLSVSNERTSDDYFNTFDPRLSLGIGSIIAVSKGLSMTVAVDYQLSVSRVNTDELLQDLDVYNSFLGLNLGLKWDI